jgi:hypothetical protein
MFRQEPWALPMLAWLLLRRCLARCCLGPRGAGKRLVNIALPASPAPKSRGSAHSQNAAFSGLWVRFRAYTLHLAKLVILLFWSYTTGRSTNPYPGGLQLTLSLSTTNHLQVRTSGRQGSFWLPSCHQVPLQNRTSGFPIHPALRSNFSSPPNYEIDSGLCG